MDEFYPPPLQSATFEIGVETGRLLVIGTRGARGSMASFCMMVPRPAENLWVTVVRAHRSRRMTEAIVSPEPVDDSSVQIVLRGPLLLVGDPLFYYQKKFAQTERARAIHVSRSRSMVGRFKLDDVSVGACFCTGIKECRMTCTRKGGAFVIQPEGGC